MRRLIIFFQILVFSFFSLPGQAAECTEFRDSLSTLEAGLGIAPPDNIKIEPFVENFSDEKSLESWARGSTFGGGRVQAFKISDEKVLVAFRSYTSGVKSSDAAVYVRDWKKNGWRFVKGVEPVWNTWIEAVAIDGKLILRTEHANEALLILTAADFMP